MDLPYHVSALFTLFLYDSWHTLAIKLLNQKGNVFKSVKKLYFLFQDESVAKCSEYYIWVIGERKKSNLVVVDMRKSFKEKLLKKEYVKIIKKRNNF